jgi:hypothetical protein
MSFSEHSMGSCRTEDCPLSVCVHADRTKWNVIYFYNACMESIYEICLNKDMFLFSVFFH